MHTRTHAHTHARTNLLQGHPQECQAGFGLEVPHEQPRCGVPRSPVRVYGCESVCECVGVCGCVGVCMCVGVWVCGCVGVWVCACVWECGCV